MVSGAVATNVAAYFFKKGIVLTLIKEHSFSSLSAAAEKIVANFNQLLATIPSWIKSYGIGFTLKFLGWDVDVTPAFLNHPDNKKLVLTIFPGNWSGGLHGDVVIHHDPSLLKKIQDANPNFKNYILLNSKDSPPQIGHVLKLKELFDVNHPHKAGDQVIYEFL